MTPESKEPEHTFMFLTSLQSLLGCCSSSCLSPEARCTALGSHSPEHAHGRALTPVSCQEDHALLAPSCPHLGWLSGLPSCDTVGKYSWQHPGPAASPMPSQTQPSKPRLLLELPQQPGDVGVVAPGDVSEVPAPPSPKRLSVTS